MDGSTICRRFDSLVSLRKVQDSTFEDIETFVVPYRGEFFKPLDSEQEVRWDRPEIYDSTAPIAADLLASSIHSNLTSPMIPWFQLRFRQDVLNESVDAQEWLEAVQNQIWQTLQSSDFDMEIAETYLDLVSYGTAILFQEELSDAQWEGMTFTSIPVRDGYFEYGADDKVLRVYRRLQYTRMQLEDKFPDADFEFLDNEEGDKGPVDEKHTVVFCVYKRDDIEEATRKMAPNARPWGYKYIFHRDKKELEEGGYYQMPVRVVRWKKVSGSRWGHSPAFVALSDIKQLNRTVAQASEARAKEIDPPLKTTERGLLSDPDLLPGGLTTVMAMDELDRLLPPHQWMVADAEILRLQESIRSTFYIDKLELKESPAMTATEVLARLDKQQRQFAPTLGRLKADLLDPLIEWTYDALARNNLLPPMPEIAENAQSLEIEYTGPIPRSMKNEEAQGTSLWLAEVANLGQAYGPNAMDVADTDEALRGLGLARGVPATYMRDDAELKKIREERAAQEQEMAEAQQLKDAADATNKFADANQKLQAVE